MFGPITIPYEAVMLYNVCRLKEGKSFEFVPSCLFRITGVTLTSARRRRLWPIPKSALPI